MYGKHQSWVRLPFAETRTTSAATSQTIRECITVSGIVNNVIVEDDGDYHVWFHVDPQYASLPNRANNDYRQGDLLAEIICATTITQQDAVLACEN